MQTDDVTLGVHIIPTPQPINICSCSSMLRVYWKGNTTVVGGLNWRSNGERSYKKQDCLPFREHLHSPPVFGGVLVVDLFTILCCVFVFYLSSYCVLCAQCCQCLWIVHSWLSLRFSLTFRTPPMPWLFWSYVVTESTLKWFKTSGLNKVSLNVQ